MKKKTYRTPKAINVAEKINSALLNGVVWFIVRALKKANTGLKIDENEPKTLQIKENS